MYFPDDDLVELESRSRDMTWLFITDYAVSWIEYYIMYIIIITSIIFIEGISKLYVGHLESKERLRIQPAQLFNFSWWVMWCVQ